MGDDDSVDYRDYGVSGYFRVCIFITRSVERAGRTHS